MRRHLIRVTAFSLMSVLGVLLIAVAAFYLRLSYGPVSLNFMTETLQQQINRNLSGMSVTIGGAVIERAPGSGVPHFRLRNIELKDTDGNLIARAPRAAIGIDEHALLRASLAPTSLELIGPRISVMRNLEGGIELGFGEAAPESEAVTFDPGTEQTPSGKSDQETVPGFLPEAEGTASLIRILSANGDEAGGGISAIQTIRVADAQIKFYDEANDSVWDIPKSDLVFQRMPYGFAVAANAEVSNGPQEGTWHADATASYRRDSKSFSVSLRIADLVPANISDEIFALSQLARVKVPLAGHVETEITETGLITKASAEFVASAGEVGLPDYLAEPIIIDEGSLRADYDPVTGSLIITDSSMLVGSSRAQVRGTVTPARDAEGRLSALKISLQARNVAIDAQGSNKSPVAVDRIDFIGHASIDNARLDIEDLTVMSGDTGVRLRGAITGGEESAGILLSGRIRDLSATLLKRLWPPIMAPKTRAWVNANISAGRITEGEFQVALPVNALARAQRSHSLPPRSINLAFRMADVTTGYVKGLPPLSGASGEARLIDNDFSLSVDEAGITLESGKTGMLAKSTMVATDILAPETLATFDLDVRASAQALIEYLSLQPLNLIRHSGFDTSKLSGDAKLSVGLELPLIKDVPKERVIVKAAARLSNASLSEALPGIDITDGEIDLSVEKGAFIAKGPAKIGGVPAKLTWQRAAGEDAKQSAVIEAKLNDELRKKMGIDLSDFMNGPVSIKAEIADLADPQGRIDIAADLSDAEMHIGAISWNRPATDKTRATFSYFGKGEKGRRIEDLVVKGPGLSIKGDVSIAAKGGMRQANLSEVRLTDENIFALSIKNSEEGTAISLKGDRFDARPLIKSMFSTRKSKDGEDGKDAGPMSIAINIDRVYAHRGEVLTGVSGDIRTRSGRMEAAELSGTFLSGQPMVMRVTPGPSGREIRINGRDGGAAIRAANLYSKIAGGQIEFYALMSNDASSQVRQGQLVLRNFEVRNEAALAELDRRGKPKKSGPRADALRFTKLTLPFTTDAKFIRIGDSLVRGDELGASGEGLIRKSDGAVDITGTIIPVYVLNSLFSDIPLLNVILGGGKGQGIIGVTFALGGSIEKPVFQMNPVSALAPGILRKLFFEYGKSGPPPQAKNENGSKTSN